MLSLQTIVGLSIYSILTTALPTAYNGTSSNPIVDLGYAQYRGVSNTTTGITTFFSLQYAAPPTGALRWQPPLAIENSTALRNYTSRVIDATVLGNQCPQSGPAWAGQLSQLDLGIPVSSQTQDEDCLRLDVIVPNAPTNSSLPVIVQIHGGGYTLGSSTTYDGSALTSYSNGSVIYVQIQYRLGFYGFLGSRAVRSNGVANAGLLDQRAALQWVQRHIAAFGGDPKKVTIWGGSAGGGSITAQLQLYGGEKNPPFRAAIAEYPWWQPFHTNEVLETQYTQLLQASNCTDLACLRNLSPASLAQANQQTYLLGYAAGSYGFGDFYAGPSVDGDIIKELPSTAFATGRYSKVPMLIDRDGYEGAIFTNFTLTSESQVQPDLTTLWQTNATSFFTRLFQLYPLSSFTGSYFNNPFFSTFYRQANTTTNNPPYWQTQSVFGDFIINCPTYYVASAATDARQKVWKLVFSAGTELHAATVPFLLFPNNLTPNATVAAWMKAYFLAFAVNLDPNSQVSASSDAPRPNWPVYLAAGGSDGSQNASFTVLSINATSAGVVPDPDANERCDFFHGQSYIVRN